MRNVYLALALIGAVLPYLFFGQFFLEQGISVSGFLTALFANGAAGGFTVDLLISSAVFWLYMVNRYRQSAGPNPVLFVLLNLSIGLSCALPAYLYALHKSQ